jgi:mannan endo-1,4-beta-mannosidase
MPKIASAGNFLFFTLYILGALLFWFLLGSSFILPKPQYIKPQGTQFRMGNKLYPINGCNYWYGGYLAGDTSADGVERLHQELDFLQAQGIQSLRVFFCGEGGPEYPYRIYPGVQIKPNQYNENIMQGFDRLLVELSKRRMTAVIVLSNNWEWSGGFGQFLEWSTGKKPRLPKTKGWDWDLYCNYIAQFYSNKKAMEYYTHWVTRIVNRVNSINNEPYKNATSILSWELANEPRPMKKKANTQMLQWVARSAKLIKKLDPNHMVTIGTEGLVGTGMDTSLFLQLMKLPQIDYGTIHLWPGIWRWYQGDPRGVNADSCWLRCERYIAAHAQWMKKINKPLVLEEFGVQRDGNSFQPQSSTEARDQFYKKIIRAVHAYDLAGYNFWGYAGLPKKDTTSWFWRQGDPYTADPPQEEQGLYSVFRTDTSTWKIISENGD